jgi:hypothetical protein
MFTTTTTTTTNYQDERSEVDTVVVMENMRDVVRCSWEDWYQRFGRTWCFLLPDSIFQPYSCHTFTAHLSLECRSYLS